MLLNASNNSYICKNCEERGYSISLYAKCKYITNKKAYKELLQSKPDMNSNINTIITNPKKNDEELDLVYQEFLEKLQLNPEHTMKLLKLGFDIEDIEVIIYPSAIKSTGSIRYPKNVDEAKFSLCYCIATALEKGVFGLDELNVNLSKGVEYIVPKIRFIEDASMEDRKKGIRGAKMVVKTKHKVNEEPVLIPKGEASKPLVWEDLYKKVEQCAGNLCTLKQQQP